MMTTEGALAALQQLQNTHLHLRLLSRQRDVEDIQGLFRLLKDRHTTNQLDLVAVSCYCTKRTKCR